MHPENANFIELYLYLYARALFRYVGLCFYCVHRCPMAVTLKSPRFHFHQIPVYKSIVWIDTIRDGKSTHFIWIDIDANNNVTIRWCIELRC